MIEFTLTLPTDQDWDEQPETVVRLTPTRNEWRSRTIVGEGESETRNERTDEVKEDGSCDFTGFAELIESAGFVFPQHLPAILTETHTKLLKPFHDGRKPDGHSLDHLGDGIRRWITQSTVARLDCGGEITEAASTL